MPVARPEFRHLPIIPAAVLKHHHCQERYDTRFRTSARFLQALWREEQGLPIGIHYGRHGRKRRLGSLLSPAAADAGRNFMTPAIAQLARRAIAYQEPGGLIDQRRLFANLLSSMPLCFNLFGSLALDRPLAARLVRRLFRQIDCKAVVDVRFEHSPGRDHPELTADRSAFDVVVVYRRTDGASGFICFEVKYSESLQEGQPLDASSLYDSHADSSGVYKEPYSALLRVNPLQQLFREHMLAQAAVIRGDWAEATFVVVAPEANHAAQRASALYAAHLTPPLAGQVAFANISLETFIAALGRVGDADFADALHDRYCAWWKVHEQVDAAICAGGDQWSLASRQPTASVAAPRSRKAA